MKSAIIAILVILGILSGISVCYLRKELLSAQNDAAFLKQRNAELQAELIRVNRLYSDKQRILREIEEAVTELDNKINLKTLEKYIPERKWNEIEPLINKLKAFQQEIRNENE